MKDIYSPLEIDEEWDQRAPDMTGGDAGGGTAVAVGAQPSDTGGGTAVAVGAQPSDTANIGVIPEVGEQESVAQSTLPPEAVEPTENATDTALEYTETDQDPIKADGDEMGPGMVAPELPEEPVANTINVMGEESTDDNLPSPVPEAGAVIEPQIKPEGATDEVVEPELKEEANEEAPEEPELPASPVVQNPEEIEPKVEKESVEPEKSVEKEDAPELASFKERLEQQRQSNIEAALRIKERAETLKGSEQAKADEALQKVRDAEDEIAAIEDELSRLDYKAAA